MITIIKEKVVGTKAICGVNWPIVEQVQRYQFGNRRPTWVVARDICNGTAGYSKEYKTKKEALEEFGE